MSRPQDWTPEQNEWLARQWEAGHSLKAIGAAAGQKPMIVYGRARRLKLHRPKGYAGNRATKMAAAAGPLTEPFPEGEVAKKPPSRKRTDRVVVPPDVDLDRRGMPKGGWKRRCQGCPTIFVTDDLHQIWCDECFRSNGKAQRAHAEELATGAAVKSRVKTWTWWGQS